MGERIDLRNFESFRRVASQWWASTFMQTRIVTPGVGQDTFDSVEMTDENGGALPVDLTRLEGFGDVVVPPKGTNAIVICKADGGVSMALMQTATRPTDGQSGDRGLYCATLGTTIFLRGDDGRIEIKQASGSSLVLSADGRIALTDKDGGTATLDGDTLAVGDVVKAKHFAGDGLPPIATAGAAVGTGSAFAVGTDTAFVLGAFFVSGSIGVVATVQFQKQFDLTPRGYSVEPISDAGAADPTTKWFAVPNNESQFDIKVIGTPPPDGFYALSVMVVQ